VDNEPDVDSEDQPLDAHIMADLYLGHCSAISAQVLVPRESDTVATAFGGFPAVPFGAPRSCFYDGATTRILKVPQAESNRVNPCSLSEFVHEGFDRKHVGVRTQRTQGRVKRGVVGAVVTVATRAFGVPHDDRVLAHPQSQRKVSAQIENSLAVGPHREFAVIDLGDSAGRTD